MLLIFLIVDVGLVDKVKVCYSFFWVGSIVYLCIVYIDDWGNVFIVRYCNMVILDWMEWYGF